MEINSIRIWRSPNSRFGEWLQKEDDLKDETITANSVYTDEELKGIAYSGFNAIWVHGLLRHIVKSDIFEEFGKNALLHQSNMNELIERAAKYGIKVFLYMQPPRAINKNAPFWKAHPDVAGSMEDVKTNDGTIGTYISLCSSCDKVKKHLKVSARELALTMPNMGGVILITASEYPSHCWGRGGFKVVETGNLEMRKINCPSCIDRNPIDVVNEIIHLVHSGIREVSTDMETIFWNWGWSAYEKDPSPTIINNLPHDGILMAGFERGGEKMILGRKRVIDEYSLSYSGPSERFENVLKTAKKKKLRVMGKLQIGTTHELATTPNLPLIGNLYDKAKAMKLNEISCFMGCWNFGNMITANTTSFNYFLNKNVLKDKKTELKNFAEEYFPGCDSKETAEAWLKFSEAMDNYPFSIPFLYTSPINYTLAYPLEPGPPDDIPCGRSWLMDKIRGSNLDNSLVQFTLEEIINGFEKVHEIWKEGVELFEEALANSKNKYAKDELSVVRACCHIFRSARNVYKVYKLRKNWADDKFYSYLEIIEDEIENLRKVLPLLKKDRRLGFHVEAFGYMFDASSVKEKISLLEKQLKIEC
jgi:hypothetical protein